jgi:hypothetical protein
MKKLIPALLTAAFIAAAPAPSYGRADQGSFGFQDPLSETVTNYPCSGGAPVLMTGTVTTEGHFTVVEPRHFSASGTTLVDYRADFPDGRYALGSVTEHFALSSNFLRPRTADSNAQQEEATLYAANGQPIGTITVRVVNHVTYTDENGNFEPDPGEFTSSVDHITIRCP